jgi:8-oxo-dGTP pyrophosphatase MutT (NUDIX family)
MSGADRRRDGWVEPPLSSSSHRLTELLAALEPADADEAEHRRQMLALLGGGETTLSRHHYAPGHFTASAFVLSPDESALLFVFHRRLSKWLQPGGHIDPEDADVIAAARREVAEETGVDELDAPAGPPSLFDVDIHAIPPRGTEPSHEHFDLRILVRARRARLRPDSDARDARWVEFADIQKLDTDDSVRRVVAKIRRWRSGGGSWVRA